MGWPLWPDAGLGGRGGSCNYLGIRSCSAWRNGGGSWGRFRQEGKGGGIHFRAGGLEAGGGFAANREDLEVCFAEGISRGCGFLSDSSGWIIFGSAKVKCATSLVDSGRSGGISQSRGLDSSVWAEPRVKKGGKGDFAKRWDFRSSATDCGG